MRAIKTTQHKLAQATQQAHTALDRARDSHSAAVLRAKLKLVQELENDFTAWASAIAATQALTGRQNQALNNIEENLGCAASAASAASCRRCHPSACALDSVT